MCILMLVKYTQLWWDFSCVCIALHLARCEVQQFVPGPSSATGAGKLLDMDAAHGCWQQVVVRKACGQLLVAAWLAGCKTYPVCFSTVRVPTLMVVTSAQAVY